MRIALRQNSPSSSPAHSLSLSHLPSFAPTGRHTSIPAGVTWGDVTVADVTRGSVMVADVTRGLVTGRLSLRS
eukprot:587401-Amorphochlora_amoeboformis.AAC.1